jgi:hypothetical protein
MKDKKYHYQNIICKMELENRRNKVKIDISNTHIYVIIQLPGLLQAFQSKGAELDYVYDPNPPAPLVIKNAEY